MDERFDPLGASEISLAYDLVEENGIFSTTRMCDILKEICGLSSISLGEIKYLVHAIIQNSSRGGGTEENEEEEEEDVEGTASSDKRRMSTRSDNSNNKQRMRSQSVTTDAMNRRMSNRSITAEPPHRRRRSSSNKAGGERKTSAERRDHPLSSFLHFTTFDDKLQKILPPPPRSPSSSYRSSTSTLSVSRENFQKFLLYGFLPAHNDDNVDFLGCDDASSRNSICGFIINPSPRSTLTSHRKSSICSQLAKNISSSSFIEFAAATTAATAAATAASSSSTADLLLPSNQAIPRIRIGSATTPQTKQPQISPRNRNKNPATFTPSSVIAPHTSSSMKSNTTMHKTTTTIRPTTSPQSSNSQHCSSSKEQLLSEEVAATRKANKATRKAAEWSKIRRACRAYDDRLTAELLAAETHLLQNLFSNAAASEGKGHHQKLDSHQYANLLLKFFKFHPNPPPPSDIEKAAAQILLQPPHFSKTSTTPHTCSDPSSSTSSSPSTTKRARSLTKEDFFNLFYGTEHP